MRSSRCFQMRQHLTPPSLNGSWRRIVEIATNPGDVVLDCFAGSATTAAVAHKLDRRWVTVEISKDSVERYCLPRLVQGGRR